MTARVMAASYAAALFLFDGAVYVLASFYLCGADLRWFVVLAVALTLVCIRMGLLRGVRHFVQKGKVTP